MKIGFIGCGNMAKPIISRAVETGLYKKEEVYVSDINTQMLGDFCRTLGVRAESDNTALVECCDIVVLAVKPQKLPEVLPVIAGNIIKKRPLVVSIAAGKTVEYYISFFDEKTAVARIFPNLNAAVGAAVSAYCGNSNVTDIQMAAVGKLCESFGAAFELEEEFFPIFGVLGGCAPAYTFMYIKALADAAAKAGLDPSLAKEVAAKMTLGSAKLISAVSDSPETLIDKVCSPGGTTIEGVKSLYADKLPETVEKAFNASLERDRQLR